MTENAVLEILRAIQTDLAGLKTDVAGVKSDVVAVNRQVGGHTRTLNVLQQDVRLIRAAVNDIARTDVTSGRSASP